MIALIVFMSLLPSKSLGTEKRVQRMAPPRKTGKDVQRLLPKKAPTSYIIVVGKAVCSLKHKVSFPYSGTITSLSVRSGQAVKKGEILARYRLTPESLLSLNRRIHAPNVAKEEMAMIEARLGVTLTNGHIPDEVVLKAPIAGRVVWVHPELRTGARLDPVDRVFEVGVMNPMCLRAHVYEEEVLRLVLGDSAIVQLESLPGWKLRGRVSRISWTPLSLSPLKPSYYEVEFTTENKDLILREGMRVIIRLFKPLSTKPGDRQ